MPKPIDALWDKKISRIETSAHPGNFSLDDLFKIKLIQELSRLNDTLERIHEDMPEPNL